MSKYICIHGHFYQPPRENPWLEEVELQDSAYPYHDWNAKITAECYEPNTASRILDSEKKIIDITDNYEKISFNFGPTLLAWMETSARDTFNAVISADKKARDRFSGHGPAIAQANNHLIMPLANSRDKKTQVIWGFLEFERRFGRKPEGMWLPETAVDLESLDLISQQGIKFVILAPHQVGRVRKIGEEEWTKVTEGDIDIKMPYLCRLKSGRVISIFVYNGPISKDVAFSNLLDNGDNFANRLMQAFGDNGDDQLASIATDGETYGHHHPKGDMALAYCLYHIESKGLAKITVYGEYLEKHPPTHEAEIIENTSWSCVHGIERWRSDCGCNTGAHPEWNQAWRAPLRQAMDWLRDALIPIYEKEAKPYLRDPWQARDDYIWVILDRSVQNVSKFLSDHATRDLNEQEKVKVLKLLGIQRNSLLMFTSCGWFFDEISGIESTQVMRYAARAIQLTRDITGIDLEPEFKNRLRPAISNIKGFGNGADVYERFVKPSAVDLIRVTAHYAISSLFTMYPTTAKVYSYTVDRLVYDLEEVGEQKLAIGRVHVHSDVTWEEDVINFAVLFFAGHYLDGGVQRFTSEDAYETMRKEIKDAVSRSNIPEALRLMDKHFGAHNYGFWNLFRDEQRRIFDQILERTTDEISSSFRQIYDHHYPLIQVMKDLSVPMPDALATIRRFVLNRDIWKALEDLDITKLQKVADEVEKAPVDLDMAKLSLLASQRVDQLMERLRNKPDDLELLSRINALSKALEDLGLQPRLWKSQNILFSISKQMISDMQAKAEKGDESSKKWIEQLQRLEGYMHVRTF